MMERFKCFSIFVVLICVYLFVNASASKISGQHHAKHRHTKKSHLHQKQHNHTQKPNRKINVRGDARDNVPKPTSNVAVRGFSRDHIQNQHKKFQEIKYPPPSNMWKLNTELSEVQQRLGVKSIKEFINAFPSAPLSSTPSFGMGGVRTPTQPATSRSTTIASVKEGTGSPSPFVTNSQIQGNNPNLTSAFVKNNTEAHEVQSIQNNKFTSREALKSKEKDNKIDSKNNHELPPAEHENSSLQQQGDQQNKSASSVSAFINPRLEFVKQLQDEIHKTIEAPLIKKAKKNKDTIHYPKPVFTGLISTQNVHGESDTYNSNFKNPEGIEMTAHDDAMSENMFERNRQDGTDYLRKNEEVRKSEQQKENKNNSNSLNNSGGSFQQNPYSQFTFGKNEEITTDSIQTSRQSFDSPDIPQVEEVKSSNDNSQKENAKLNNNSTDSVSFGREGVEPGYDLNTDDEDSTEQFIGEASPTGIPKTDTRNKQYPPGSNSQLTTQSNSSPFSNYEVNHQKVVDFVTKQNDKIADIIRQNGVSTLSDLSQAVSPAQHTEKVVNQIFEQNNKTMNMMNNNLYNSFPTALNSPYKNASNYPSNIESEENSQSSSKTTNLSPSITINSENAALHSGLKPSKSENQYTNSMDGSNFFHNESEKYEDYRYAAGTELSESPSKKVETIETALESNPSKTIENSANAYYPYESLNDASFLPSGINPKAKYSYEMTDSEQQPRDYSHERGSLRGQINPSLDKNELSSKKGNQILIEEQHEGQNYHDESTEGPNDTTFRQQELSEKPAAKDFRPNLSNFQKSLYSSFSTPGKNGGPHGPSIAFDVELPALISRGISNQKLEVKSNFKTKTKASAKAKGSASSSAISKAGAWSNGKSSSSASEKLAGIRQNERFNSAQQQQQHKKLQDLRHNTYKGSRNSYGWGQGQGFGYGKTSYGRGGGHAWAGDQWERQQQSPGPYSYPGTPNNQQQASGNQLPQTSAPSNGQAQAQQQPPPAVPASQYLKKKPVISNAGQKVKQTKMPGNKNRPDTQLALPSPKKETFKKIGQQNNKKFGGEQATGSGFGNGYGNKGSWGQGGGYAWAGKAPPQGAPNPADFLQRPPGVPEIPNVQGGSTGQGGYSNSGGTQSSGMEQQPQQQQQPAESSAASQTSPPVEQPQPGYYKQGGNRLKNIQHSQMKLKEKFKSSAEKAQNKVTEITKKIDSRIKQKIKTFNTADDDRK